MLKLKDFKRISNAISIFQTKIGKFFWQRGREDNGVVFTMTLIAWSGFNPHPAQVVASLDKTLYNDFIYAWWFRTSIKLSGQESKKSAGTLGHYKLPKQLQIRPSTKLRVVTALKCVRIIQWRLTLSGDRRINIQYLNIK